MDAKIPVEICTLKDDAVCEDCGIERELMCRFKRGDLAQSMDPSNLVNPLDFNREALDFFSD